MKKLMLVLIVVISFVASANALSFRTTQSLCWQTEQIILSSNGTFVIYDDGVKVYSGSYSIDRSTGGNAIELYVGEHTLRCTFSWAKDRINISSLTFRGNVYRPCRR